MPRSEFMTQSLVLPIDVCRGLGISPLRIHIGLGFSQADHGPTYAQKLFFSFFLQSFDRFILKIYAHDERNRNLMAGIFEIVFFRATSRSHCHRSKEVQFSQIILTDEKSCKKRYRSVLRKGSDR